MVSQSSWRDSSMAAGAVQLTGLHSLVTSLFLPRQGHTTWTVNSKVHVHGGGGIVRYTLHRAPERPNTSNM